MKSNELLLKQINRLEKDLAILKAELNAQVNPENLKKIVSAVFMLGETDDFLNHGRKQPYVFAVQIYAALLKEYAGLQPEAISPIIKRHRTLVYHCLRKVKLYKHDRDLKVIIDTCYRLTDILAETGEFDNQNLMLASDQLIESIRNIS